MLYCFKSGITVYAICDLHNGAQESMHREFKAFLTDRLEEPNTYFVFGGDLSNNGTKSSITGPFEDTIPPREQKEWVAEILSMTGDRTLCIVPGNHEARSKKDADDHMLYDAARIAGLGDLYRENAAFLVLRFGDKDGSGAKNPTYTGLVMHGSGYGRASVGRNEMFAMGIEGLDFFITGHTHQGNISRPQRIVFDSRNMKVKTQDVVVMTAVSWLDYGGYAFRGMYRPASHKPQQMEFLRDRKEIVTHW